MEREVTKEEFWKHVMPANVHPWPDRERTVWKYINSGQTFGRTTRGYLGSQPERPDAERFFIGG